MDDLGSFEDGMKRMHFFNLQWIFAFQRVADFKVECKIEMSLGFRVVKIRDSGPLLKRDSKNPRSLEFRV